MEFGRFSVLRVELIVPVTADADVLEERVERLLSGPSAIVDKLKVVLVLQTTFFGSRKVAERLVDRFPQVFYVEDGGVGRGSAFKAAYTFTGASAVVLVNADLLMEAEALESLVRPLLSGEADIVVGADLSSEVKKSLLSYGRALQFFMGSQVENVQHGFKAFTPMALSQLNVASIKDTYFFDTEVVLKAQNAGLRIVEADIQEPVKAAAPKGAVKNVARMYFQLWPHSQFHKLFSFGLIGVLGTVAYGLLYFVLHALLGAQLANFVTLTVLTVLNIAANRHFTYRKYGREGALKHYLAGFWAFVIALVITSGGLWIVEKLYPGMPSRTSAVIVTVLSLVATVAKYVIFSYGFREKKNPETAIL